MSNKKHPTTSVMYPNGIPAGREEPRRSRNSKSTLIPSCIKILSPGRTDYENKKASSALLLLWRTCSQRKHKGTTPSSLGYISCYITSRKERKRQTIRYILTVPWQKREVSTTCSPRKRTIFILLTSFGDWHLSRAKGPPLTAQGHRA